jgi:hypothetical protein
MRLHQMILFIGPKKSGKTTAALKAFAALITEPDCRRAVIIAHDFDRAPTFWGLLIGDKEKPGAFGPDEVANVTWEDQKRLVWNSLTLRDMTYLRFVSSVASLQDILPIDAATVVWCDEEIMNAKLVIDWLGLRSTNVLIVSAWNGLDPVMLPLGHDVRHQDDALRNALEAAYGRLLNDGMSPDSNTAMLINKALDRPARSR